MSGVCLFKDTKMSFIYIKQHRTLRIKISSSCVLEECAIRKISSFLMVTHVLWESERVTEKETERDIEKERTSKKK